MHHLPSPRHIDFELVDVSNTLPALKRMPGLNKWIMSVDRTATQFFETYEELMASSVDQNTKNRFAKTQWAPENINDLHIERCMRIYPHLQDTGGFFVAVLERKKKEPATSRYVSAHWICVLPNVYIHHSGKGRTLRSKRRRFLKPNAQRLTRYQAHPLYLRRKP